MTQHDCASAASLSPKAELLDGFQLCIINKYQSSRNLCANTSLPSSLPPKQHCWVGRYWLSLSVSRTGQGGGVPVPTWGQLGEFWGAALSSLSAHPCHSCPRSP